jgi:hypothetical protein
MFFSVNQPEFAQDNQELVKFVLNRETTYLPPKIKIYCSLMTGTWSRSSGISVIGKLRDVGGMDRIILSEITFPPFVYVMTIGSAPPDERLTEITWFSSYEYNQFDIIYPRFNVLPVNYYLPGDYRTVEQMINDRIRNEIDTK